MRFCFQKVPYVCSIPNGLTPGSVVLIKGLVVDSSKQSRFCVNLSCGLLVDGDKLDNIALHVNPRFCIEDRIVLNSLVNNQWGAEYVFPNCLKKGHPFEIRILVLTDMYKIVPFKQPLTVIDGLQVFITATPTSDPKYFFVNFLSSLTVVFHSSIRFNEKAVVRNTFSNGKWEKEERDLRIFPFLPNGTFDMVILCQKDGYKVRIVSKSDRLSACVVFNMGNVE
ncbi:unnamed protein product [Soboliphyme baturini]|uniref:Galectin n=1 Tax=Soboliphyme baturini TaxID=241478 RepID=A0A183IJB6_9BILA|nr:unnamed protein product [Soboliphyme baturini]